MAGRGRRPTTGPNHLGPWWGGLGVRRAGRSKGQAPRCQYPEIVGLLCRHERKTAYEAVPSHRDRGRKATEAGQETVAGTGAEQEMLVETVANQEMEERGLDQETETRKFNLEETPIIETRAGQTEGETEAGEKT